ncbi:hypothetical protein AMET1_0402 [Methanonatronarchaeum thermophilum]|uniref:Uncharacterized protein n=1 Tax=Methanonatronarchaeum thermophilum TaxID=1927129 RepID=A0A1Y3GBB5_9EURY|nr:hypothetical protein [Methanonatronarchaeum thermophilum]OUJ18752.1 hypothetical protein AMET1_0402 [Methanonatronarchaeum thermophilum]
MIDIIALFGSLLVLFFSALIFADGVLGSLGKSYIFKDIDNNFKIIVGLLFLILLTQNLFKITITIG